MIKTLITATLLAMTTSAMAADNAAQKQLMTPEDLWAMGRVGAAVASPDGKQVVYQVGYYSVKDNNSRQVLYVINTDGSGRKCLQPHPLTPSPNGEGATSGSSSMTDPAWVVVNKQQRIAYLSSESGISQVYTVNADGTDKKQVTQCKIDVEGFAFSPDGKKLLVLKSLPYNDIIQKKYDDLPKATGMVITDMNYRHWDHYVTSILHPFVIDLEASQDNSVGTPKELRSNSKGSPIPQRRESEGKDLLEGEPYECPMAPFGGIEELAWSPDSKTIAYTCRKKTGTQYAISTDSDIFLYDLATGTTKNICKSADFVEPKVDATKTMQFQEVNSEKYASENMGYDQNPQFSPDGKYIAWQSMKRDGYESDRNCLCVYDVATGKKNYVTEYFDSNCEGFAWANNSKELYFIGVWHGTLNIYRTDFKGNLTKITDEMADFTSLQVMKNGKILAGKQSMSQATELYIITASRDGKFVNICQLTNENEDTYSKLAFGKVEPRWCKTTDGKDMLSWIITPPNFDPNKKYPTLLFCEGGPQSPVSQFWSFRWNMQIMAANGYIVVAPNRHGLPGFGSEWCEEISGDWTGQCMDDYKSAIDDACNLPYVDKERLGCVGASFGGFSVYYLAGHHEKRFKAFIAHDGAFNLESMYTDTEEAWFSNWEYDDAYWNKDATARAKKTYENSPHRFIDKWDTPILCIHGEKDYRINANQGFGAFNAARLRGIPAELLLFPDENHWVLKPQNGILWQRTFFGWLDKWLKK